MKIYQTIKRRMTRAEKRVDSFVGYSNHGVPSLNINLNGGYAVEVSFADLAQLVKKADEYAAKAGRDGIPESIADWRTLQPHG